MKHITKEFFNTYEEKKSKFIAHICPYSMFDEVMKKLKIEHPKARHYVYAYRYLNEFNQIVENSSDDGEPKGTSGKPSLTVLAGNELINTGVIIVRYFGGVKLGTGGLVRAYSDAVNEVISKSDVIEFIQYAYKSLDCPYSDLSKVEYLCEQNSVNIDKKVFDTSVHLTLKASKECFEEISKQLPVNLNLI